MGYLSIKFLHTSCNTEILWLRDVTASVIMSPQSSQMVLRKYRSQRNWIVDGLSAVTKDSLISLAKRSSTTLTIATRWAWSLNKPKFWTVSTKRSRASIMFEEGFEGRKGPIRLSANNRKRISHSKDSYVYTLWGIFPPPICYKQWVQYSKNTSRQWYCISYVLWHVHL